MTGKLIKLIFFRLPTVVKLLASVLIIMTIFGTMIHFAEPGRFPTIFDGIWWAFITAATVGYGDYVPLTTIGRLIAIALILTGGGVIAFYISSIAAATVQYEQNLMKGKIDFKGKGHYIFIGWNERTRQLIRLMAEKFPDTPIVVIDRTEKKILYEDYPVHFIHGDASDEHILLKANIKEAAKVLITANTSKAEKHADSFTILSILTIRGTNKDIPIVAEILSKTYVENALRAGASTIIRSNDFLSTLLFHELSHQVASTPFEDILEILKRKQFSHMPVTKELEHRSFLEASNLLMLRGYLLLGIIRENQYKNHPPEDYILQKGDILLAFVSWQRKEI